MSMTLCDTSDPMARRDPRTESTGVSTAANSRRAGSVVGAGLAANPFGAAGVSAAPAGAGTFVPLPAQRRIADTRKPEVYPFERLSDRRIRVGIHGVPDVPANATAAVLTVTVVNRSDYNFVTVYPAGAAVPEASNLNATFARFRCQPLDGQLGADGAATRLLRLFTLVSTSQVSRADNAQRPRPVGSRRCECRARHLFRDLWLLPVDRASSTPRVVPSRPITRVINCDTGRRVASSRATNSMHPLHGDFEPQRQRPALPAPRPRRQGDSSEAWRFKDGRTVRSVIVDVAVLHRGSEPSSSGGLFVPIHTTHPRHRNPAPCSAVAG